MLVHVDLNEELEFFIEVPSYLDFSLLRTFLLRRQQEAPEVTGTRLQNAVLALELISIQTYGFPVVGGTCTGAYRYTLLRGEKYSIQTKVITVYPIGE
jgi:hypothetical protein